MILIIEIVDEQAYLRKTEQAQLSEEFYAKLCKYHNASVHENKEFAEDVDFFHELTTIADKADAIAAGENLQVFVIWST